MQNYSDIKSILVLGGKGQVGSVLAVSNLNKRYSCFFPSKSELDITNSKQLLKTIQKYTPDVIINCAALTDVDFCEENPEIAKKINLLPITDLVSFQNDLNFKLIQISSDYVFSGNESPYSESSKLNPVNHYGESKALADYELISKSKNYLIIRPSRIFSSFGKNFFLIFKKILKENKEIKLVNDELSCPTYARSLANFIFKAVENHQNEIFHFSSSQACSLYDFGTHIFTTLKNKNFIEEIKIFPISGSKFPRAAERPLNTTFNLNKVISLYPELVTDWKKDIFNLVNE